MIAYLTDVEGRWDKLASFADGNPLVWLEDGALRLADGATFVFGGDAIDRGPAGRRIVETFLAARRAYGDRVILLAGNRDINKLRLVRELAGEPPAEAPPAKTRGELLRWIFAHTMGAPKAFDHRAAELGTTDDEAVVQSYLDDLAPGGALRSYLAECRLAHRAGATLFVHGGVTAENFPGDAGRVDAWVAALNEFYRAQLASDDHAELIAYQAPLPGSHLNQESVVYARPTDEHANPRLPDPGVVDRLRADGVFRVVVGHTPSGDCPAILRDGNFELVLADNSYSRIELGSQIALSDDEIRIRAQTELDDGRFVRIDSVTARAEVGSPLGLRDPATGQLVKARLSGGAYLLFKGLPGRRVEQIEASDVASRALVVAR